MSRELIQIYGSLSFLVECNPSFLEAYPLSLYQKGQTKRVGSSSLSRKPLNANKQKIYDKRKTKKRGGVLIILCFFTRTYVNLSSVKFKVSDNRLLFQNSIFLSLSGTEKCYIWRPQGTYTIIPLTFNVRKNAKHKSRENITKCHKWHNKLNTIYA